jgi:hypothetical protein
MQVFTLQGNTELFFLLYDTLKLIVFFSSASSNVKFSQIFLYTYKNSSVD